MLALSPAAPSPAATSPAATSAADLSPAILLDKVDITLGQGASQVHVLRGLSLQIAKGQSVGIVGPSGSGKSTLLMVMAGLEQADSGRVEIAGTVLNGLSEDQIAAFRGRNIGIVFQSFHLIPNMTALENVAVPLELAGVARAFARAEAELRAVGLGARMTLIPANCRVANSSAWRSPARWRPIRRF
jgi:putative ABC transport system ATP-binding protein